LKLLLLLAFWSAQGEFIKLEPVDESIPDTNRVALMGRGEFLAASTNSLYHWTRDGHLLRKISFPGWLVTSFLYDGTYYLICGYNTETRTFRSRLLDSNGNELGFLDGADQVSRYFLKVGGEWLGTRQIITDLLYENPFPFLLQKVEYSFEDGQYNLRKFGYFGKLRPIHKASNFNFRLMWAAKKDGIYYVVNQMEPLVFIYNEENREAERQDGTRVFTDTPSIHLSLKEYVPRPEKGFSLKKPMPSSEAFKLKIQFRFSWSRITWFQEFGKGFVIGYGIPNCSKGKCNSPLLGIQLLDKNMKPIGKHIKMAGDMLGANEGKLYVFQANREKHENGSFGGMKPIVRVITP